MCGRYEFEQAKNKNKIVKKKAQKIFENIFLLKNVFTNEKTREREKNTCLADFMISFRQKKEKEKKTKCVSRKS